MEYKNEIRFVVTKKCNANCVFCHNEGCKKERECEFVIKPNDYSFIASTAQKCLGINKFVLTGGEPLLHPQIIGIAKAIKNGNNRLNIITNGFLLGRKSELADIADEIHISLGSLSEKEFNLRTRTKGMMEKVLESINDVIGCKSDIKLNVVMVKSENKNEKHLENILEYAKNFGLSVYLVEIYPEESDHYMSFSEIEKIVKKIGYERGLEKGIKVMYEKKDSPKVWIVFVPCAFVVSPLVDDPVEFCKKNQSIYILPNLTIQPCFEKPEEVISIYNEVNKRDEGGLVRKIKLSRSRMGKNCPLLN